MSIPYSSSTAGDRALMDLQRALAKFGCQSFGSGVDVERGVTMVWFRWRERDVRPEANWKGYAQALLKGRSIPNYDTARRRNAEVAALEQAKISVCSCLRVGLEGEDDVMKSWAILYRAMLAAAQVKP